MTPTNSNPYQLFHNHELYIYIYIYIYNSLNILVQPHFGTMNTTTPHEAINEEEEEEARAPHEALFFVLAYLPLLDLLGVSQVCKSLNDCVNDDVLLWLHILINAPLNWRITDETLTKLVAKARGRLTTLALINCVKITDDGLQRVVDKNPCITQLLLPSCTGLSPPGVVRAVKTLTQKSNNLKKLQIKGIYNIENHHLETLRHYLQPNHPSPQQEKHPPRLYNECRNMSQTSQEASDRQIDVELCPKCSEVRMVFDCSREPCKRKTEQPLRECRACYFCVARCEECGGCVDFEEESIEAVCEDILCLGCWLRLPKCDFCNKPYCGRHAAQWSSPKSSTGFICHVCNAKFVRMFDPGNISC